MRLIIVKFISEQEVLGRTNRLLSFDTIRGHKDTQIDGREL
jgi:hypothetical protein